MDSKILHDTIKAALSCASTDGCRPHINGVLLDCTTRDRCTLVATDGNCLVAIETDWQLGTADILLPRDSVQELLRLLAPLARPKTARDVDFNGTSLDERKLATTDERFPPYRQVIPQEPPTQTAPRVGLDVHLLSRVAKIFDRGAVFAFGQDDLSPITAKGKTEHGYDAVFVLMPMRV